MWDFRLLLTPIFLGCYLFGTAWAHHSRGNFDLENTIELNGIITEFTWRNPHTFATLAVENEEGVAEEWLLELNSIAVLTGTGWDRNTLKVGDEVTVVGNLEKNHTSNFFFANYFVLPDASRMVSAPRYSRGVPIARPAAREIDTNARSADLSGIWRQMGTGEFGSLPGGPIGVAGGMGSLNLGNQTPARGLPLTELGQAELAVFDVRDNPWFRCETRGLPGVINGTQEIVRQNEQEIVIRYQLLDIERIVHLDIIERPPQLDRSRLGHSIGWFEGETLIVDTALFEPVEWGIGAGIPSSAEKHIVERYSLVGEGNGLQIETMFEDPVYMTEPVEFVSSFVLDSGYQWQEYNCDPYASRRHLDVQ